MKNAIFLLLAYIVTASYTQTECKPYVPYSERSKWEITNYSPKGKETCSGQHEAYCVDDKLDFKMTILQYER